MRKLTSDFSMLDAALTELTITWECTTARMAKDQNLECEIPWIHLNKYPIVDMNKTLEIPQCP
jgi:hypothetical protein